MGIKIRRMGTLNISIVMKIIVRLYIQNSDKKMRIKTDYKSFVENKNQTFIRSYYKQIKYNNSIAVKVCVKACLLPVIGKFGVFY